MLDDHGSPGSRALAAAREEARLLEAERLSLDNDDLRIALAARRRWRRVPVLAWAMRNPTVTVTLLFVCCGIGLGILLAFIRRIILGW